jgi:hypothetical protein
MNKKRKLRVARREFLRSLGIGVAAAAGAGRLSSQSAADTETNDEKRKPRYRESEHVRAFYRVNRYPV